MKDTLVVGIFALFCFGLGVAFDQAVEFKILEEKHIVEVPGKRTVTIFNLEDGWHPSFENNEATITFEWTDESPIPCGDFENSSGCSWTVAEDKKCRILMNTIEDEPTIKDLLILGHETLHCLRGKWHDYNE